MQAAPPPPWAALGPDMEAWLPPAVPAFLLFVVKPKRQEGVRSKVCAWSSSVQNAKDPIENDVDFFEISVRLYLSV